MPRVLNPVLTGFHADPSMIRVGDTYYIANSTFEWYPGVEIHQSKDMRIWESVPSPLAEKRLLDMTGEIASCGIWAPCLSYSDGLFYLIYTNVRNWNIGPWKDTPNFLTTAPAIEGPWSDPVFLNASGFDPSFFHDDDGKKWLVNMEWDWRGAPEPATGQFSGILLQEYSPSEKKLTGPIRKIYQGSELGLVEGPHLYKRNGWYYIFAAEGGTAYHHAETAGRSRSLSGPYEMHPHNPLITSYGGPAQPVQKAGHASWCDSPDGRSYIAFLCGRPLPGTKNCVLGRETSIVEIEWHEDWPYVKPEPGKSRFVEGLAQNYPTASFAPPGVSDTDTEVVPPVSTSYSRIYKFDGSEKQTGRLGLPLDFKTLRNEPDPAVYSLSARKGFLRLRGGESPASHFHQTLLARRQTDFSFSAETRMEFSPKYFQEFAGLIWRYDEPNQYLLSVSHDEKLGKILLVQTMIGKSFMKYNPIPVPDGGIWLGLTVDQHKGRFRYSLDGKTWRATGPALDAAVLSDEYYTLGFTGAFAGMFCADLARYSAYADFEYFSYTAG
ncbi:MAG: glycoside hydrolase family 43 protein [Treponema sp.]|nr:glycoside hydrolase family 43 protein [Treponema sp.]